MTVRPEQARTGKRFQRSAFLPAFGVLLMLTGGFIVLPFTSFGQTASAPQAIQGNVDSWLAKADAAIQKRNFVSAQSYLARAKSLAPQNGRVRDLGVRLENETQAAKDACLKLAFFYRSAKNIPKAIEQYQKILAIDPKNAEAVKGMSELGQTVREVEQYQKAGIVIHQSTGRSWDTNLYSVVSQMRRARDAFAAGNLDLAQQLLKQALEREKGMAEATKLLDEVETAIRIRNLLSDYHSSANKGEMRAAIESLDNLILMSPDEAKHYLWRGRLSLRLGNFTSARSDFFSAVKRGTPFSDVRLHLAECAAGLEEFPQAYALGCAHPKLPGTKDSGFLWTCHWKSYPMQFLLLILAAISFLGAVFLAFQQFDLLIGRRPLSLLRKAAAYLLFCRFQDPMADPERAGLLAKSLRLPWFHYLYALICCRQGKFDAAQESFQAAMGSRSLAPRAYFIMGLIRRKLRQSLQEHDFEQMVNLALREPPAPWMPNYLKLLEAEVLDSLGIGSSVTGEAFPLAFQAATELGMIPRTSFER